MINKIKKRVYKIRHEAREELKYLMSKQKPIVFDHIPKCGGSTVNRFLTGAFPKKYSYGISGVNSKESVEEFKKLPSKIRFKTKLVYGHLANELLDFAHPESIRAVVLREPIDRIISHYYFVKRTKEHYLYKKIHEENVQLEEYCYHDFNCYHNIDGELQNFYVTHFTGLSISEVEKNPEKAIELAFTNIVNQYHIIGFQDDIPSFIRDLESITNINAKFNNEFINQTQNRKTTKEVNQNTLDKISKNNSLDIELYAKLISLRDSGELKKGCVL